jgi:hypothetical protein
MATKKQQLVTRQRGGALATTPEFDAALLAEAERAAAGEALAGQFLSVRGGILKFGDQKFPNNEIEVVSLDHILENAYYVGKYEPEAPQPPICFAFGRNEKDLVPHPASTQPQHASCAGCPRNAFGTADNGKGKACKNIRRVALVPAADLTEENAARMSYAMLKIPVTSVRGWSQYVNSLKNIYRRPPTAVVTKIRVEPDEVKQVLVSFEFVEALPEAIYRALQPLRDDAVKAIDRPYEAAAEGAAPSGKKADPQAAARVRSKVTGGRRG